MKQSVFCLGAAAFVCLFSAGCSTPSAFTPAEITLEELEIRQKATTDPQGRYASAKSSILREEIKTENGWPEPPTIQMVEVKYQAPDKFRLTTFEENQPASAVIINGTQGWVANYTQREIATLDEKQMKRVISMLRRAPSASRLRDTFVLGSPGRGELDGEDFYRLTCSNPDEEPMEIYVNTSDFLPRRIKWTVKNNGQVLHYDSEITRYQMVEGMQIPDESTVKMDEGEQSGNVIYYKLDVPIPPEDFRPPVF
ncbi:MAG: hypothetical protein MJ016_05265 [Victivallaceae bacterium]|nr:hypothetical protein [Victivallaceae bacterium]